MEAVSAPGPSPATATATATAASAKGKNKRSEATAKPKQAADATTVSGATTAATHQPPPPKKPSSSLPRSVVSLEGLYGSDCGYCDQKGKIAPDSKNYGAHAHLLLCDDYQAMIDCGWRRSGKFLYKPQLESTCCVLYTIRCDATNIALHHSHKKHIKRIAKYLRTGVGLGDHTDSDGEEEGEAAKADSSDMNQHERKQSELFQAKSMSLSPDTTSETTASVAASNDSPTPSTGAAPQPVPPTPMATTLEDILAVRASKKARNQPRSLESLMSELTAPDNKHKLEVSLVPSSFSDEEYALYLKYQSTIHKDHPTRSSYKRFLCDSPLVPTITQPDYTTCVPQPSVGYGSFHQQYRIDGVLVAVGVIDLLPHCLSSVYFFYDPVYAKLGLGVFSALYEQYTIRQLVRTTPSLRYQYLGYYLHTCQKMRYKGQYAPSELQCPESFEWFPLAQCVPKLEASPYARLNPIPGDNLIARAKIATVKLAGLQVQIGQSRYEFETLLKAGILPVDLIRLIKHFAVLVSPQQMTDRFVLFVNAR
ncbi:hypothetical protein CAOG_08778 [Capsaspora owczarzaki ATCC 30864]|uniref:Arginyl-tRNA--protein transferase 1 n=1 Tax=Capsaspora owczarzaki (strain ATCC 30864) TaxID=595528 RepID=A0A0D2WR85_CAPO3|nr:hypothetical protein CAOG_08778 [Capsaspora owczarzaki ATCC 30864]KJE93653.1 hypothetical protein CAOG_008778 [Capsaspora owczarzaki ATCC 30864]|eukprot:XP_011270408.1 hypothetical protein CAOG_08778 [Capsaspora owczarzaki ATCC 30864]